MNFFDYVNSINYSKKNIMVDDLTEDAYNSFMVNRGLSYFQDTVIYANEMNKYHHLDNRLQYDFLLGVIRSKKRFSKWAKPDSIEALDAIKEYYGYSNEKARQVLKILTKKQLDELKIHTYKGGKSK